MLELCHAKGNEFEVSHPCILQSMTFCCFCPHLLQHFFFLWPPNLLYVKRGIHKMMMLCVSMLWADSLRRRYDVSQSSFLPIFRKHPSTSSNTQKKIILYLSRKLEKNCYLLCGMIPTLITKFMQNDKKSIPTCTLESFSFILHIPRNSFMI